MHRSRSILRSRWSTAGIFSALILLVAGHECDSALAGEDTRPNILWISAEDISPDLGCYGDDYARTPNIDQFAREGMLYRNAFTHAGVCAPSRSGLITGMYPTSIGTQHMRSQGVPPAEVKCFPEYLRAAGYYCTNNSKTDYNFASPLTAWDESSGKAHWRNRPAGSPFFCVINLGTTHESQIRLSDEAFANKTRRLTAADRHDPAQATLPPYYPDTPAVRKDWANYYDLITVMDLEVAEILKQLEADGLAENTLVFFWGDHGRGLPRGKRWVYDSGIRVPLLIRWPKHLQPGSESDEMVCFLDFAPTLLSLAGVQVPDYMQGQVILGEHKAPPREYIFAARDRMDETYDIIRAVRDKQFKYIKNYQPGKPYAQHIAYMELMPTMQELRRLNKNRFVAGATEKLEGPQLLFMRDKKPDEELYDTTADPHEINNLAGDPKYAEVLQRMRKVHIDWTKETGDLGHLPEEELKERMRPGGKWSVTAAPQAEFRAGTLTLNSATEGASIGYRVTGDAQAHLAQIIGLRDARVEPTQLELIISPAQPAVPLAKGDGYHIYSARWPVLPGIEGAGLVAFPSHGNPKGRVICLPDAAQTPEGLFGLAGEVPRESQFARRLAESGCLVIVPALINRETELSSTMNGARQLDITHREYLYRPAYELGRHLIGYEVQQVLALVDGLKQQESTRRDVAVVGHGEGGLLALCAGAVDPRIDVVGVSGFFQSRQNLWTEPLDRNLFGFLKYHGDAELASLIAPRPLLIEACAAPECTIPPGTKGGPGSIATPALASVQAEFAKAEQLVAKLKPRPVLQLSISEAGTGPAGSEAWLASVLAQLPIAKETDPNKLSLAASGKPASWSDSTVTPEKIVEMQQARLKRQFDQIARHTQALLVESPYVRAEFMQKADRVSRDPQKFAESMQPYRDYFRKQVIGAFDLKRLPLNPRSRKFQETDKYTIHEVVLDVFPDVIAYGLYILPKGIKPGEKRPVVVCQHGLEGRPQDVIGEQKFQYYSAYATKLAEQGFITFAPQNIYIFKDRFRTLQRKANPLGKSLFSIMVPQHEQIVEWLGEQPEVDAARIGFYGLSYGGKSAMRIPALVEGYCLSICSADFNEWIWKNVSNRSQYTYVGTGEYEIFEFDLGSTFNYSEMAALICPRPFMVERGHRDGVAPDDMVAAEYARVKLLYVDLHIPTRTEIEFFDGPHAIHGVGTFRFLHEHLKWNGEKSE